MTLAKLEITPLDEFGTRLDRKKIKVLFNPESYSISKSVNWNSKRPDNGTTSNADDTTQRRFNAPMLKFGGGASRTLTVDLFFDVTEPIGGRRFKDVRLLTNKLVDLTRIDRLLGYPPIVRLTWGKPPKGSDFPFTGVVTGLTQRFTLFSQGGKPLRADLNVTFLEFIDAEMDQRQTDPELTTRRVRRGDTLSSLAGEIYHDPALWRLIAEANGIDDPRHLDVGSTLSIPDLN